jgi:hypothetical protein
VEPAARPDPDDLVEVRYAVATWAVVRARLLSLRDRAVLIEPADWVDDLRQHLRDVIAAGPAPASGAVAANRGPR